MKDVQEIRVVIDDDRIARDLTIDEQIEFLEAQGEYDAAKNQIERMKAFKSMLAFFITNGNGEYLPPQEARSIIGDLKAGMAMDAFEQFQKILEERKEAEAATEDASLVPPQPETPSPAPSEE